MKASRKKQALNPTANPSPAGSSGLFSPSLTPLLSSAVTALAVATVVAMPLVVSEGAIAFGTHLPTTMLIFVLVIGWSLLALQRTALPSPFVDAESTLRSSPLAWTAAALLAWHTLSGLAQLGSSNGRWVLNAIWLWLGLGASAWLIGRTITTTRQVRALVAVMIAVAVVLTTHAGYQYLVSFPQLRAQFQTDRQTMVAGSDQQYLPGTPEYELLQNRVTSPEPLATFALTNSLAGYLAPWLVAAAIIGLQVGWRTLTNGKRTTIDLVRLAGVIVIVVALAVCLLLTKSRTGVLATITGGCLFLLLTYWPKSWGRNWMIAAGVTAAVIGVVAAFGLSALDASLWHGMHASVLYRLEYWHSTLQLIAGSPIFGCGPGNFQDFYPQFKLPQASETVADPHNFLMEVAATAGVPGLILLLSVLVLLARTIGPNCKQEMGAASPDPINKSDGRDVLPIYCGGGIGLLVAWPFGLLVGYPAENFGASGLPVFLILGLPLLLLCLVVLHGWVLAGSWTLGDVGVVFATLFINLFAAGSTSFPGVIVTAWVLSSLVSNEEARLRSTAAFSLKNSTLTSWASLACGCLLAIGCYFTAYRPVLQTRLKLEQGQELHALARTSQAEAAYRSAAAEDPWSPVPWQHLGVLQLQLQQGFDRPTFEADLAEAADAMIARSPHSANTWLVVGNWKLLAYRFTGRDAFLEESIRAYERAKEFYPSDAYIRAQLAWVYHLQRDDRAASREAEIALQLDASHQHAERKLSVRRLEDVTAELTKTAEPLPEISALDLMQKILAGSKFQ